MSLNGRMLISLSALTMLGLLMSGCYCPVSQRQPASLPTSTLAPAITRELPPTSTPRPTFTLTPIPSPTLPPTRIPTRTRTPTATATDTPPPTATATNTPSPTETPTALPTPFFTPTPILKPMQPPLDIILSNVHYEAETSAGGRYFHTDWTIRNLSGQTLHRVWRPVFEVYVGSEFAWWSWGGYYDCDFGWPAGRCYKSLKEQPDIQPGQTVPFTWYVITERAEEWVKYTVFEALGWRWTFEFDSSGNVIGKYQEPFESPTIPSPPPSDYD